MAMDGYRLVSLCMYDLPEARHLTDAWWQGLARHMAAAGIDALPPQLERTVDEDRLWRCPDLLLSQTCGYPLALTYHSDLQPVVTLAYTAPSCEGSEYLSHIVVPEDSPVYHLQELRGTRLAFNSEQSNSGWRLLLKLLESVSEPDDFVFNRVLSGSHRQSIEMVRTGRADYCAVDCVTYALLERHAPSALEGVRVLCNTPRSPGLPYVTGKKTDSLQLQQLRESIFCALEDPELEHIRAGLLIGGATIIDLDVYMQMVA